MSEEILEFPDSLNPEDLKEMREKIKKQSEAASDICNQQQEGEAR